MSCSSLPAGAEQAESKKAINGVSCRIFDFMAPPDVQHSITVCGCSRSRNITWNVSTLTSDQLGN
jgi:hypothetical protein